MCVCVAVEDGSGESGVAIPKWDDDQLYVLAVLVRLNLKFLFEDGGMLGETRQVDILVTVFYN